MRKLKKIQHPRSYDQMLLSITPDDEIISIIKEKRKILSVRIDVAHERFLKKEAKRLGWSKAAVFRGIMNMYMEEAYTSDREAAANGDLKYWSINDVK